MISICFAAPFDEDKGILSDGYSCEKIYSAFGEKERKRIDGISNIQSKLLSLGGLFCLKTLTDRYLDGKTELTVLRGSSGRPEFARKGIGDFNISHSASLAVAAFCSHGRIGIDIERVDRSRNIVGISERFFCSVERAYIESASDKYLAFYKLWTAKEAFLKANGVGISSLSKVDVLSDSNR